jgi:hypothetical protein
VESSEQEIRVFPQDGLKKRLMFVPDKIDLEALRGEIDYVVMSDAGNRMELRLSDSTGVVKEAEFELNGSAENSITVSDAFRLSLPIADAEQIRIDRV